MARKKREGVRQRERRRKRERRIVRKKERRREREREKERKKKGNKEGKKDRAKDKSLLVYIDDKICRDLQNNSIIRTKSKTSKKTQQIQNVEFRLRMRKMIKIWKLDRNMEFCSNFGLNRIWSI